MSPFEDLWIALTLVFVAVGMVRGFLKELGVTIVLVATLFGLDRVIPLTEQFVRQGKLAFLFKPLTDNPAADQPTNLALMLVFGTLLLIAVFVAYQGETLAYEGKNPGFPVGALLGAMIGGVNGYLVTGTLWWLMDHYHYPIPSLVQQPFSSFATTVVSHGLLPLELLGGGTQSVESLGLLPIILVVLILLKVVR